MTEDEDEFGPPGGGLEMGTTIDSETHEDVDPFEELGIGSRDHKAPTNNDGNGEYFFLWDIWRRNSIYCRGNCCNKQTKDR